MQNFIPVYSPSLTEHERRNVLDCLDSGWISSKGKYVEKFQTSFCDYTGINYARAVCNGTVAIQVALAVLDLRAGDEVIVPSFTYIASVTPIIQINAVPVFVTSDNDTWLIDVKNVERKITPKTRAIMVPHLYGNACDMLRLSELAKQHNLFVIEDCAESLGTFIENKHTGAWGDIACFSFFGNKTITTGEGGMVATNNPILAQKIRQYCNQGLSESREYWHDALGFNYRMTNIQAAIGCAQLSRIKDICREKIALADEYRIALSDTPLRWQKTGAGVISSFWMVSALCRNPEELTALRTSLRNKQIETRPFFPLVHTMPMFKTFSPPDLLPTFPSCGLNLPSWPGLSSEERNHIFSSILEFYTQNNSFCA